MGEAGTEGPRVAGIVLAAGPSTRFRSDRPKQLAELRGEPLVRRVTRQALASRLEEVLVVVGFRAAAVRAAVADLEVVTVENPRYREGQSTSVRAGLDHLSPHARGALFLPADQPLLSAEVLDALIRAYGESGGPIVVPVFAGERGAPVLFDRSLFAELARVTGDAGGRQLLPRHPGEIVEVPLASREPLLDVDTREDLLRLEEES